MASDVQNCLSFSPKQMAVFEQGKVHEMVGIIRGILPTTNNEAL